MNLCAMNLGCVEAFDGAVTRKSATRATEQLFISHSALSSRTHIALELALTVHTTPVLPDPMKRGTADPILAALTVDGCWLTADG